MSGEAAQPAGAPRTDRHADGAPARTVRDATFDVLRERGLDTILVPGPAFALRRRRRPDVQPVAQASVPAPSRSATSGSGTVPRAPGHTTRRLRRRRSAPRA